MLARNIAILTVLVIFGYLQIGVIGLQCYDSSSSKITCNNETANATSTNSKFTTIFGNTTITNSTEFKCIAFNYTESNKNLTYKGCAFNNVECKTTNNTIVKECKLCNTDLCNNSPKIVKSAAVLMLPIIISFFGLKFVL